MHKKHKIQQKYTLAYYKVTHVKSHLPVCQTKQMCLNFCLKVSIDLYDRISLGREFHILGVYQGQGYVITSHSICEM